MDELCHQHATDPTPRTPHNHTDPSPGTTAPSPAPKMTRHHEISFTNPMLIQHTQFIWVRKSDLKHITENISLPIPTWYLN